MDFCIVVASQLALCQLSTVYHVAVSGCCITDIARMTAVACRGLTLLDAAAILSSMQCSGCDRFCLLLLACVSAFTFCLNFHIVNCWSLTLCCRCLFWGLVTRHFHCPCWRFWPWRCCCHCGCRAWRRLTRGRRHAGGLRVLANVGGGCDTHNKHNNNHSNALVLHCIKNIRQKACDAVWPLTMSTGNKTKTVYKD